MALFQMPLVRLKSASSPRTVFWFVKQPCWQVARACGASAKQVSTNGMRRNARKGERFIKFFNGRVVVFIRAGCKKPGQLGKTNWDAVIRVYDAAGKVIETHEHAGDFKEW